MRKEKFTEGPWVFQSAGEGSRIYNPEGPRKKNGEGELEFTFIGDTEVELANAMLISAAPDLYEALKECLAELKEYQMIDYYNRASGESLDEWVGCTAVGKAEKALMKATGEQE